MNRRHFQQRRGMDVFCVGMYRSGSTWQYGVAGHLLERHRAGQRLGFVSGDHYTPNPEPTPGWRVLKAHDRHVYFTAALLDGRARALYSYRDLRDVCFSLMHKFRLPFAEVVKPDGLLRQCLVNDAFWRWQPHVLYQRYEDFVTDPAGGVAAIAAHLGITLEDGAAAAVAAEYSLAANQGRAVALADRLRDAGVDLDDPANAIRWDAATLLHWNHIRAGRVGDWRRLATRRQLARLAEVCGQWLIANGYETDGKWATQSPSWAGGLLASIYRFALAGRAKR
jgi:hypothetical protein